jgi:phosphoribosylamine--glycine ligase
MSTVLVIGSYGREHALAWKLAQSPHVSRVLVAPGNGGTAAAYTNVDVAVGDLDGLVALAKRESVALTVVGPEAPLAAGLADRFQAEGLRVFGPSRAAAQIEASKAFSKALMDRMGVPTARWGRFTTLEAATDWLDGVDFQVVVKASGLAAGKGVVMCTTRDEAVAAAADMLEGGAFGGAGAEIVIEERVSGPEVSLLAITDGTHLAVLPPAQDHKRVGEGDTGLNTGGMGAYAPAPVADGQVEALAALSLAPILEGLAADGTPYTGVLYAGLMLTERGPIVLEYNCRLGDPETQVLLPLLDTDLYELCDAAVDGRLAEVPLKVKDAVASTVVAASEGYPRSYPKGRSITGVDAAEGVDGVTVFHAGTRRTGDGLETSGGRVLAVTGVAGDLREALAASYAGLDALHFEGMHYRRDIGWRALENR